MAENVKENSNKIIVEEVMEDGSMNTLSPKCFIKQNGASMNCINLEDIIYHSKDFLPSIGPTMKYLNLEDVTHPIIITKQISQFECDESPIYDKLKDMRHDDTDDWDDPDKYPDKSFIDWYSEKKYRFPIFIPKNSNNETTSKNTANETTNEATAKDSQTKNSNHEESTESFKYEKYPYKVFSTIPEDSFTEPTYKILNKTPNAEYSKEYDDTIMNNTFVITPEDDMYSDVKNFLQKVYGYVKDPNNPPTSVSSPEQESEKEPREIPVSSSEEDDEKNNAQQQKKE